MAGVLHSSPRMSQLESIWTHKERVNIIKQVAPWWRKIGRSLQFDRGHLESISDTECSKGDEACCRRLFQQWLKGAGVQPAQWDALLEALARSGMHTLVEDIAETLTAHHQYDTESGIVELISPPSLAALRLMKTPDGRRIEIIKTVAPMWWAVGDLLDFDRSGKTMDTIYGEEYQRGGEEAVCRKMFQLWLDGKGRKPVSWATLLDIMEDSPFKELAQIVRMALTYEFEFPEVREAEIVAKTKVEIVPGQPLDYCWEGHGFEVHVPAGAVPADGAPVIMSIQASLEGQYQLPDDRVLVSGVYWLALHPPVKFAEKVTVGLQHCAEEDSDLSFITAACTQEVLPYSFKPLKGGSFSEPAMGNISVNHFSGFSIFGKKKSKYAIRAYYIPTEPNIYTVHITVTPKLSVIVERVSKHYESKRAEEGPHIPTIKFEQKCCQISLKISSDKWEKDGWELCPLSQPSIQKESVDDYKGGPWIPSFDIRLKLVNLAKPRPLEERVMFDGIQPPGQFIVITREPRKEQFNSMISDSQEFLEREDEIDPPTMPELLTLQIHQRIGSKFYTFGLHLLNDTMGTLMEEIENDSHGVQSKMVIKIFQEWLKGRGEPVTWQSLQLSLKKSGNRLLAKEVKKKKLRKKSRM